MPILDKTNVEIREVWSNNLDHEFTLIRDIADKYRYVAMDTEFPGFVLRPVWNIKDYNYQEVKENVNILKLIQLGLTFSDEKGNLPTCGTGKYCVWQFNFREFNPNEDVCSQDSIELLDRSGIDFKKNNKEGVSAFRFSELLMSSDVVANQEVRWLTFHGAYDFGYLVKLLSGKNLPDTESEFFQVLETYFPVLYDIKYMMRFCWSDLHGGLNKLAEILGVERIGDCHQAGSDSLLTSCTFFELVEVELKGSPEKYAGVLCGLGTDQYTKKTPC